MPFKKIHSVDYPRPGQYCQRRGAMLVMILFCLVVVFVGAAFAIDIAHIHTTRAELRTAADAAARAGAEALSRTQDRNLAIQAAIDVAARNQVAGVPLILRPGDIELGENNRIGNGRFSLDLNSATPNSVRVVAGRVEGSASGPVPLFLFPIFGVNNFQPVMVSTAAATTRDIALVLDVSGSMRIQTGTGTRLTALVDAVNGFIDEIKQSSPNTQMSLSIYSSTARQISPLTSDLESIRLQVGRLRARGATAIGAGLLAGSDSLESDAAARAFASKTIVIMTDGQHNSGKSPAATVTTAVERNQTVHTITFSAGANQGLMQTVAELGGGIHVHADGNHELEEAFREIARTISVLLIQ